MADKTATDWFAWFVSAAFFGVIALLALRGLDETGSEAVLILVGQASGAFGAIISYRYGTTVGSEKKSDTITDLAKTAAAVQAATTAPEAVKVELSGDITTGTTDGGSHAQ